MRTTITKQVKHNFYGPKVENETYEVKTSYNYKFECYEATVSLIAPILRFVHRFFNGDEKKAFEKAVEYAKAFEMTIGVFQL